MILSPEALNGYEMLVKLHSNSVDSYAWRVDSTRPAVEGEGCTNDEECGCCYCDAQAVTVYSLSRPRWSKSGKAWVLETRTEFECAEHLGVWAD